MPSFTQKNMFDLLDVEEAEDYDEVDVEEPVEETTDASPAPLSKGAKKRAAKAARAAAAAEETKAAPDVPKVVEQPTSNGKKANGSSASEEPASAPSVPKPAAPAVAAAKPETKLDVPEAAPVSPPSPSPTLPSSAFKPVLPDDLPHPSSHELPANRKRKTPQDFAPNGPNSLTPTSPNKNSVKFEDGVVPGEGREGEKTITKTKADAAPKVEPKHGNAATRTIWTFIMIFGFITLLCMGHPYMIVLVLLCQSLVYKEITALFDLRDNGSNPINRDDQWNKTLNWYFFVVTNYFLYGESIIYYFKHIVFVDAYFIPFAKNHRFISFMLYVVGFVGFVSNLKREYLRQQFALFCWVHITLLLVVVSSHFIVNNILEGLIWFFIPASLVINNDVMAYVCGKLFGRTPLLKLSPKKTVEGFVGAFILTLIFSVAWGTFWQQFNYMICPAHDLGVNAFSDIQCRKNPVFVWTEFFFSGAVGELIKTVTGRESIWYTPFQLHCLVMATFASLVAPFGGFFASGFKRAFNIKDFGDSIPGHGGMTDRMDCQFMMGLFAYVYYSSQIRVQYVTVGSILQTAVVSLTLDDQVELARDLITFLKGQGVKV